MSGRYHCKIGTPLTEKEAEAVRMVCHGGKCLKEVAADLKIASKTLSDRLTRVYRRLGMQGGFRQVSLTKWALRHGLTTL